jgi:D-3-phosphoglycerate dehydrogenase
LLKILVGADSFDLQVLEELRRRYVVAKSSVPVMNEEMLCKEIGDADIFIMGREKITPRVLSSAQKLKIIGYFGVGVDASYFPQNTLTQVTQRGIPIVYSPGGNSRSVAELTVGLILDILKKTTYLNGMVRKGAWTRYRAWELARKTLGVAGAGNIGQKVARILHNGFDMRVIYFDVVRRPDLEKEIGAESTDLMTLLEESDIVTLHMPLLRETRHLINEQQLKSMKRTAYLINAARADLVSPAALRRALEEKWIAGAAFDGYYIEPAPRVEEDPFHLLSFADDVFVCTPHIAAITLEANARCSRMLADGINQIVDRKQSDLIFNPDYVKDLRT